MGFWKHINAIGAAAAAVLALGATGAVQAADFTLKFAFVTANDQQHEYSNQYKAALEAATGGKIEVKIFPRGQLGSVPRMIEGVQLGTIEAIVFPTDFYNGMDPRFGVFSIPALFNDKQHASRTLMDPELNDEILGIGANKGVVGITIFPHSVAHYFGKKPILKLEDFKGMKMRVNATPAERERMNRFGASAIPMPLPEVVPSLQRGVIDGTMSGIAIYVFRKFIDINDTLTVTNDTLIISQVLVNKGFLDKLPADLRKTVIETGLKLQGPFQKKSDEMEAGLHKKWGEIGGKLHRFTPAEQAELERRLASVGEEVTKGNPQVSAFFNKIKAVSKKYE